MGLGLLSFLRYQAVINENVNHELHTLARETSGELTLWLRERVQEVRALSTADLLINGLTAETMPSPASPGSVHAKWNSTFARCRRNSTRCWS